MLRAILNLAERINEKSTKLNPFTWVYGLGRSFIALSLLSVFLFTDINLLFDRNVLQSISESKLFYNKINFFSLLGFENLIWSKVIAIILLLSVVGGIYPRITGVLHFWIVYSFHNACIYLDGGDQISTIMTALLIPITLMDSRLNHWGKPRKRNEIIRFLGLLFFKIISLQVAFIYFHTAVEKIYKLNEWKDGTALYYILQGNYFGINKFLFNLIEPFLMSKGVLILTWWVLISHLLLAFALFVKRRDKKMYFLVGLSLHFGIAIFLGLYSFSLVMIGALILYMLPFDFNLWKESYLGKSNFLKQSMLFSRYYRSTLE